MENKLKPIIVDSKILNIDIILKEIRNNKDGILLNEYLIEIKDYLRNNSHVSDFNQIVDSLIRQLDLINNPSKLEDNLISESEFNRLVAILYSGDNLPSEMIKDFYLFVDDVLNEMKNGTMNYDRQNSLDIYIYYLKDKKIGGTLYPKEVRILDSYDNIIDSKLAREREREANSLEKEAIELKLKYKENSRKGMIISVVVLEATILLGILVSVIALAKR